MRSSRPRLLFVQDRRIDLSNGASAPFCGCMMSRHWRLHRRDGLCDSLPMIQTMPARTVAIAPPTLPLRCGAGRSLRSETASAPRSRRLWRNIARAQRFARIAAVRKLPCATPAAVPRPSCRPLLPPLTPVACTSFPRLQSDRFWSNLCIRSIAARASGARSRCTARAFAVSGAAPEGCLIIAPAPAGVRAAQAPPAVHASRYCSLRCAPPCATVLNVGIPPGRLFQRFGPRRNPRSADRCEPAPSLGA